MAMNGTIYIIAEKATLSFNAISDWATGNLQIAARQRPAGQRPQWPSCSRWVDALWDLSAPKPADEPPAAWPAAAGRTQTIDCPSTGFPAWRGRRWKRV